MGARIPCVIFDLDGTLADCEHRRHLVTGGNEQWDEFYDAMVDDVPNPVVAWLFSSVRSTRAPIGSPAPWQDRRFPVPVICTSRPEAYRPQTEEWLLRYCLVPHRLYMKADRNRPDAVVKLEMLQQLRADGYEPLFVVDDRDKVVAMWREEGLTCLQCAPGDF